MKKLLFTAVALIGLFGNQAQAQNTTKNGMCLLEHMQ